MNYLDQPIHWNQDRASSVKILANFMLNVIAVAQISFSDEEFDPEKLARLFFAGQADDEILDRALDHWWSESDKFGIGNFEDRNSLRIRLALSVLNVIRHDQFELTEQLQWFMHFMEKLGKKELVEECYVRDLYPIVAK